MPTLDQQDDVFILDLGDTENRFHPDWISSIESYLEEVAQADGPRALVAAATGKFFSNGLDLDWLSEHLDSTAFYIASVQRVFARLLTLPLVTVAAIQGHAFAAGAMLSLAHDFRVMRADRGYWCLPEAEINIPFTPGMSALIRARLNPQVAHQAMTTARRYGGSDAEEAGIVDRSVDMEGVNSSAIEIARAHTTKAGPTLGTIKTRMYDSVLESLGEIPDELG